MRKNSGFAIITALMLVAVLIGIMSVLLVEVIGNLRQSRASVQQAQALAISEAGDTYGQYVLQGPGESDMETYLTGYTSTFIVNGSNPATTWIVPQNDWAVVAGQFQNSLNTVYANMPTSDVNGLGTARVNYQISRFRGVTRAKNSQTYTADYVLTTTGIAGGGKRHVQDKGIINIQLGRPSLSQWLFLVNDAGGTNGFFPTGTVFNGPVHANHNWGFWGTPIFKGVVSTSDDGAYYYDKSFHRHKVAGDSYPPFTVPQFDKGFIRNAPLINLPTSTLSQQRAALGLNPATDLNGNGIPDPPSKREICEQLLLNQAPYNYNCNKTNEYTIPGNGIFLVNDGRPFSLGGVVYAGKISGGIYVNASLSSLVLRAAGNTQVYTLKQGGNSWVITVDYATNSTTLVKNGGTPQVYQGTPNGAAPIGSDTTKIGGATGQIYVKGTIGSLSGPPRTGAIPASPTTPDHPPPSEVQPALAVGTQLNITAVGQVGITGDLTYACDPTQLSSTAYLSAHPSCSTGKPLKTVLGVMSQDKNVMIKETANQNQVNNIYLWGSYLAGTSGHGLAVQNPGGRPPQGAMHLFGGIIQSVDQIRGTINSNGTLTSGYREHFDYDARFASSALAPPNFPTVRVFRVQRINPVPLSFHEY